MKSLLVKKGFVVFCGLTILCFSFLPQKTNASIFDASQEAFVSTMDSFTKGLNFIPQHATSVFDQTASVFSSIKDLFNGFFGSTPVPTETPSEPAPTLRERSVDDVPVSAPALPTSISIPEPVVSQYINVTGTGASSGVSPSLLYSELNALEARLRQSLGSNSSSRSSSYISGDYVTVESFDRQVDAIFDSLNQNLDVVQTSIDTVSEDVSNISVEADPDPEFDTLTVTGDTTLDTSLTGLLQAVNGLVSASSTVSVKYGGTGLSTLPSYGNVLVGNASGGYTLTATSSLGLIGLNALSSSATGLTYNSSTGDFSLTSGYNIPKTASTTNWNDFYDTPSSRITDGAGLTWSSNTLNCDTASGSVAGCLSSSDWTTFNNKVSSQWTSGSSLIYYTNKVGIGVTVPTNKLDVSGAVAIGSTYAGNATAAPADSLLVEGRIGIGTLTPVNKLDVNGAVVIGGYAGITTGPSNGLIVTGRVGIASSTPSASLAVQGQGTGTGRLFALSDSNNAEKFSVLDNGTTIIGATTTRYYNDLLTVVGNMRLTHGDSSTDEVYIRAGTTTSGNGMNLFLEGGNHNDINGGQIQVRGSSSTNGGGVNITASGGASLNSGGNVNLNSGSAGSHTGANIAINGANSGSGGGSMTLTGGFTNSGRGGQISITGGGGSNRGYVLLQEASTGFVGIGTSTPSARLSVKGETTTTGRAFVISDSNNAEKFSVLDNGNTIIGATTTAYNGDVLTVYGNLRLTHGSSNTDEAYIRGGTTTSGNNGMNLYLEGGSFNNISGGQIQLRGANSNSGGNVSIQGSGGSVDNGGNVNINAGGSQSGNGGGSLSISGGNSSNGGDITIQSGNTSSGGTRGASVSISGGSGPCCNNNDNRGYILLSPFNTDGKVGVGTSTPWGQFSINPNNVNGPAFVVGSSTATRFIVASTGNVGVGTTSPASTLTVTGSACISRGAGVASVACSTTTGTITANVFNTANADVAERYKVRDTSIEEGEIVALDPDAPLTIKRARSGDKVFGIISTEPGFLLGSTNLDDATTRPVALAGRVPVKFSTENGSVHIGDSLMLSSTPGVAMKANQEGGYIIGTALENMSHTGTVMVFVQSQFTTSLAENISLPSIETVPESEMADMFDDLLSGVQQWMYGKISASVGFFKQIFADTVTTNNLEIKGEDGNIYCVVVDEDGKIKTRLGECDSQSQSSSDDDSDVTITPSDSEDTDTNTEEPATTTESVVEEESTPAPEQEVTEVPPTEESQPQPEPASTPEPETPQPSPEAPASDTSEPQ